MDETVSRPSHARHGLRALWPLLLPLLPVLLAVLPVRAQGLLDPTMPPPEARQVTGMAPAPVSKGPQLQSVLVGSNGRQVAVIDGQTVRQGEKFNGALLVKVDKNHAVLRRGSQTQVLTLYPDSTERNSRAGQAEMRRLTKQPAKEDRD
jgi:MSHA biogenesis protein MshK